MPSRSRPNESRKLLPRFDGSADRPSGSQTSRRHTSENAEGATPMIVYGLAVDLHRRTQHAGDCWNRRFHSPSLITATRVAAAPVFVVREVPADHRRRVDHLEERRGRHGCPARAPDLAVPQW